MKRLEKFADDVYALLRIIAGLMFSFHGLQIVFGVFLTSFLARSCLPQLCF